MPIITCLWTNDRGWKDRFLFIRGDLVWGRHGLGGMSGHWKATSKKNCLSSFTSTSTNLSICAGWDFNKALSSGLITEERTRQLLESVCAERDYKVALSEENLKSSRLWAFVEERQGIHVFLVDLVLPILCL